MCLFNISVQLADVLCNTSSLAQQPEVSQGLLKGCHHGAELSRGSRDGTTLLPITDNPGYQDLKFKQCIIMWMGVSIV